MEYILDIKADGIDSFMDTIDITNKQNNLEYLEVAINGMPGISQAGAILITKIIESAASYKQDIIQILDAPSSNNIASLSKILYAKYLGATIAFENTDNLVTPTSAVLDNIMPISNILEGTLISAGDCDDIINKISKFTSPSSILEVFYNYAILKNFIFSKPEARFRMKNSLHADIISALLVDESISDFAIAIELCMIEGFFITLSENIERFTKRHILTSLIFVAYYNANYNASVNAVYKPICTEKEIILLRGMIDSETKKYLLKVGNVKNINSLLGTAYVSSIAPTIRYDEFKEKKFNSKESFFVEFINMSSLSPTHLFSYLEMTKSDFVLNDEDQKLFITLLKQRHSDSLGERYLDIVIPKLIKFGIIKEINCM